MLYIYNYLWCRQRCFKDVLQGRLMYCDKCIQNLKKNDKRVINCYLPLIDLRGAHTSIYPVPFSFKTQWY